MPVMLVVGAVFCQYIDLGSVAGIIFLFIFVLCSALGFLGTVFDWDSILWGKGTPNDRMRETAWVLGKIPE